MTLDLLPIAIEDGQRSAPERATDGRSLGAEDVHGGVASVGGYPLHTVRSAASITLHTVHAPPGHIACARHAGYYSAMPRPSTEIFMA
jgi:hypothetical protein